MYKKLNLIFIKQNHNYIIYKININHKYSIIPYICSFDKSSIYFFTYLFNNILYLKNCKDNVVFIFKNFIYFFNFKYNLYFKYVFKKKFRKFLKSLISKFSSFIIINSSEHLKKLKNIINCTNNLYIDLVEIIKKNKKINYTKLNQKMLIISIFFLITNNK